MVEISNQWKWALFMQANLSIRLTPPTVGLHVPYHPFENSIDSS